MKKKQRHGVLIVDALIHLKIIQKGNIAPKQMKNKAFLTQKQKLCFIDARQRPCHLIV